MYRRMFRSIPDIHSLDASSSSSVVTTTMSTDTAERPLGQNHSQVKIPASFPGLISHKSPLSPELSHLKLSVAEQPLLPSASGPLHLLFYLLRMLFIIPISSALFTDLSLFTLQIPVQKSLPQGSSPDLPFRWEPSRAQYQISLSFPSQHL